MVAGVVLVGPVPILPAAANVYAGTPNVLPVAGPIAVSASPNTDTCRGGTVRLSVNVSDANGNGLPDATVTGHVQYRTTGHDLAFPSTDSSGSTSIAIDTGRPSGGYNVVFTVDAAAGGYTAETQTTCYAP
jgi:hypothetical protein